MLINRQRPFHPLFETESGAGSAGGTILGANALPSTHPSVPRDQRGLPAPTDPASRGVSQEGLGDGPEGGSPGATESPKFFSQDFDPNTLPAALREPYQQMQTQFQELSRSVPPADVLASMRTRADAFDRIAQSEDFRRFLNRGGNLDSSETTDDDLQQIEGIEPEALKTIQRIIDQGIRKGIEPVLEYSATERAKAELTSCERDYGDDWKNNSAEIHRRMTEYGLPARQAFLQLMGEKHLERMKVSKVEDIRAKQDARGVGTGAVHAVAPASTKRAKTMREAMLQAEEQFISGEAFDPNSYALHAGHI